MAAAADAPGPLDASRTITKLPAQDLDRARRFYRDRLGLEPAEERPGGLRYLCGDTEFHVFASAGAPSGTFTQLGFEVADLDVTMRALRDRGVEFEDYDLPGLRTDGGVVHVDGHYPSKGSGELGAWFRDSEGNLISLGQAID
jgi:catechol 2,3-dioxygenase-like lactoylglutathione lyase family enzyme